MPQSPPQPSPYTTIAIVCAILFGVLFPPLVIGFLVLAFLAQRRWRRQRRGVPDYARLQRDYERQENARVLAAKSFPS